MILNLNYQYLAIRKRQVFHTFLVPFSVYSYRKQLSKNTEKTTARADQTTCRSVVIETLLKLKNIFFFRGFFAGLKEMNLKTRPIYSRSPQLDIQVFKGSNYQEIHIFRPKKVMMNRLYCLDRKYCSHFCTGVSLLII